MHSNPGCSKILYLDFDGHVNVQGSGGKGWKSFSALPYDPSGNGPSFTSDEKARMALIWQRVAEDYIIFDVDVTTEEPPKFNNTVARALITRSTDKNGVKMPRGSAGGIAFVGIFGSNMLQTYGPALSKTGGDEGGRERDKDCVCVWREEEVRELQLTSTCVAFFSTLSVYYDNLLSGREDLVAEATSHELGESVCVIVKLFYFFLLFFF